MTSCRKHLDVEKVCVIAGLLLAWAKREGEKACDRAKGGLKVEKRAAINEVDKLRPGQAFRMPRADSILVCTGLVVDELKVVHIWNFFWPLHAVASSRDTVIVIMALPFNQIGASP